MMLRMAVPNAHIAMSSLPVATACEVPTEPKPRLIGTSSPFFDQNCWAAKQKLVPPSGTQERLKLIGVRPAAKAGLGKYSPLNGAVVAAPATAADLTKSRRVRPTFTRLVISAPPGNLPN